MLKNRQRIPQAVWFGLMLGLPVAAGACSDAYDEPAANQADDSVDAAKDAPSDASVTEVQIEVEQPNK
jgi:hypothetical protein